jgi:hypothetical protein
MLDIYRNEKLATSLGGNGKRRVIELFGFESFQRSISKYVDDVCSTKRKAH